MLLPDLPKPGGLDSVTLFAVPMLDTGPVVRVNLFPKFWLSPTLGTGNILFWVSKYKKEKQTHKNTLKRNSLLLSILHLAILVKITINLGIFIF